MNLPVGTSDFTAFKGFFFCFFKPNGFLVGLVLEGVWYITINT